MSSEIQNKLLQYEVSPPEGVWDKIAATLDDGISPALSEKLYNYQEEPSSSVWQNITAQLDQPSEKEVKIVPFHVRYRRPLKYTSAAAVFIFLAVITSLLISKKTESELPADRIVNNQAPVKKDSSGTNPDSRTNNTVSEVIEKSNLQPSIAKAKIKTRSEAKESSLSLVEDFLPRQVARNPVVILPFNSEKYMIYSDDEGNAVRLPKKLFNAFACQTDDANCKERLQQLREKFAESATTADFTGLLDILKSLQENQ